MNKNIVNSEEMGGEVNKELAVPIFDELTKLYSQSYIDTILTQQYCLFKRNFQRFGVAVVDIDKFDKINENFGTSTGNLVLKFVASILKRSMRASDFLARFEANKFIIVCPITELLGMEQVSARTIEFVHSKGLKVSEEAPESLNVSVSIGAAIVDYKDDSAADIITRTKKVLLKAEEEGGDKYSLD